MHVASSLHGAATNPELKWVTSAIAVVPSIVVATLSYSVTLPRVVQ
jgi:hypothetical protein